MTTDKLLKQKEAAEILNVSSMTIHRMRLAGTIKRVTLAPGCHRYRLSDLMRIINDIDQASA